MACARPDLKITEVAMKTFSLFISLVVALAGLTVAVPAQAARVALVIGNAAYSEGPLKNPVNDARAMDQKLTSLGFKVQRVENLKRQQIGRTLTAFGSAIRAGDEVVVFYAGHGLQVKGVNYLPAVDADIQSEDDVPLNSLNLNALMDRLDEAKAGLKLLFLDACRNNPYARNFRGGDRGLARLGEAPSGTLIHFATRPGRVAADGTGTNGLYTSQLIRYIDEPNTPVETMLKRVSAAVESASKGQQEPWTEGSIKGEFFFKPGTGVQVASIKPEFAAPTAPLPSAHTATPLVASPSAVMPQPAQTVELIDGIYKILAGGADVKDTKTGLIWQRCSLGQSWNGSACIGVAKRFSFTEAQKAVDLLNVSSSLASGKKWRIPTRRELSTLIYCSDGLGANGEIHLGDGLGPILRKCIGESYVRPTIRQSVFPNTPHERPLYVVLSTGASYSEFVDFDTADCCGSSSGSSLFARLVRTAERSSTSLDDR